MHNESTGREERVAPSLEVFQMMAASALRAIMPAGFTVVENDDPMALTINGPGENGELDPSIAFRASHGTVRTPESGVVDRMVVTLRKFYAEVVGGADAAQVLAALTSGVQDHLATDFDPTNWAQVRPNLSLALLPATQGVSGMLVAPSPFMPLMMVPVIDRPHTIMRVMRGMVDGWGVEPSEIYMAAYENLVARVEARGPERHEEAGLVFYTYDTGDGHDAARVLAVPALMAQLDEDVETMVVAIPHRDLAIIVPVADPSDKDGEVAKALSFAAYAAKLEFNNAHPVCPFPFLLLDRGGVIGLAIPDDGEDEGNAL